MGRGTYSILVALPNLIYCKIVGLTGIRMERMGKRMRLSCIKRMQRVVDEYPRKESPDA